MKNLGSIHKGALVVACSVGLIQHAVAQVGGTANVSPPTSPGASSTTTVTVVSQESQSSPDVKLATSSAPGAVGIASNSTTDRWNQWLAAEGNKAVGHPYAEGVNSLRDGRIIVFQSGEAEVRAAPGDPRFISARNVAFNEAELNAKQQLAEYVGDYLKSNRGLGLLQQAAEEAPPAEKAAVAPISIMDKALVFSSAALDEQIKKYDPTWDGTGKTEAERQAATVKIQEKYRDQVSTHARLFTSGAFTIASYEGPNVDGRYSVKVGIIWSPRLAEIADAVYNPSINLAPMPPGPSILSQLDALNTENPDAFAVAEGTRVWTDENGQRVVVAFGCAPATSSTMIDRDKAAISARQSIQQFVAETVETDAETAQNFTYQETDKGVQSFDAGKYKRQIDAKAKDINLIGSSIIKEWRGKHPVGNVTMEVVAVVWTPSGAAQAGLLSKTMDAQEKSMGNPGGPGASGSAAVANPNAPIAAPVRAGPTSNPSDF